MTRKIIITLLAIVLIVLIAVGIIATYILTKDPDPFIALYGEHCSTCHGAGLEGIFFTPVEC